MPNVITVNDLQRWTEVIGAFPLELQQEVSTLPEEQLDASYRPGGWTVRQVVHHCADSHMNAFIRFKLALTEENPTVKPYFEGLWAEQQDGRIAPVEASLDLLKGLHARWYYILMHMDEPAFNRVYTHPEQGKVFALSQVLANYAWHCQHHLGHVKLLSRPSSKQ